MQWVNKGAKDPRDFYAHLVVAQDGDPNLRSLLPAVLDAFCIEVQELFQVVYRFLEIQITPFLGGMPPKPSRMFSLGVLEKRHCGDCVPFLVMWYVLKSPD